MHILRLAALPLALGFALSGCFEPDAITSSNPTATAAQAGGVAFHLSGADSLALVGKADSVRIEATRTGYPTHSVSGSLQGTTRLSDLEPGLWNLKIALYDASLAVRWAGDTTVNIFSGTTADAVVRLHPATGSVNVRIILDTTSTSPAANDTLHVGYAQWTNDAKWGVIKAWRTIDGIYLYAAPPACAFLPVVRLSGHNMTCPPGSPAGTFCESILPVPDSSVLVLDGSSDPLKDCYYSPVALPPVTHFVPWTRRGAVTLHTSTGDILLEDVATSITVMQDSSFSAYSLNISGGVLVSEAYTLDPKGAVTRRLGGPYVDTTAPPLTAILPPDSLAIALAILQSPAVRHPAPLVRELVTVTTDTGNSVLILCKTSGADILRSVGYANNTSSSPSWSPSSCAIPPMSWEPMNRLDAMLKALFPAKQNPPGVFLM
jgi:hypothetical protein